MNGKWLWGLLAILELAASGIAAAADDGAYYLVTHRDYRKCPAPVCGGVFVREVNKTLTRCADGKLRPECYVNTVDYPELAPPPSGRRDFAGEFARGFGLARGRMQNRPGEFGSLAVLIVAEVWRAQARRPPSGDFYKVTDSGIRCIAFPCDSLREERLNTQRFATIAGLELDSAGAPAGKVSEARNRLYLDGVVAAGRHAPVSGPAGSGRSLLASEFYLRELQHTAAAEPPQACGTRHAPPCPEGQWCDSGRPGCPKDGLPGTCELKPDACTLDWNPVCGCDGVTYGNDCQRRGAGVGLAYRGECRPGSGKP